MRPGSALSRECLVNGSFGKHRRFKPNALNFGKTLGGIAAAFLRLFARPKQKPRRLRPARLFQWGTAADGGYFQPLSVSQALRSVTWVFSHWVMDWDSLLSIFSFMQVQYFRITPSDAAPLLSFTQALIHLTSSVVTAEAVLVAKANPANSSATVVIFTAYPPLAAIFPDRRARLSRRWTLGKARACPHLNISAPAAMPDGG
jgi:hypothetical protein